MLAPWEIFALFPFYVKVIVVLVFIFIFFALLDQLQDNAYNLERLLSSVKLYPTQQKLLPATSVLLEQSESNGGHDGDDDNDSESDSDYIVPPQVIFLDSRSSLTRTRSLYFRRDPRAELGASVKILYVVPPPFIADNVVGVARMLSKEGMDVMVTDTLGYGFSAPHNKSTFNCTVEEYATWLESIVNTIVYDEDSAPSTSADEKDDGAESTPAPPRLVEVSSVVVMTGGPLAAAALVLAHKRPKLIAGVVTINPVVGRLTSQAYFEQAIPSPVHRFMLRTPWLGELLAFAHKKMIVGHVVDMALPTTNMVYSKRFTKGMATWLQASQNADGERSASNTKGGDDGSNSGTNDGSIHRAFHLSILHDGLNGKGLRVPIATIFRHLFVRPPMHAASINELMAKPNSSGHVNTIHLPVLHIKSLSAEGGETGAANDGEATASSQGGKGVVKSLFHAYVRPEQVVEKTIANCGPFCDLQRPEEVVAHIADFTKARILANNSSSSDH